MTRETWRGWLRPGRRPYVVCAGLGEGAEDIVRQCAEREPPSRAANRASVGKMVRVGRCESSDVFSRRAFAARTAGGRLGAEKLKQGRMSGGTFT